MSPQEPQERGNTSSPATGPGRSLRDIPGFTVAVVAFVMIVILGIGGIAVANWSQTATVTMGVTAGAAATTPAPSTPSPPAVAPGTIQVEPRIEVRPATVDDGKITCPNSGNSRKFNGVDFVDFHFAWPAAADASSYVVSLKFGSSPVESYETKSIRENTFSFPLQRSTVRNGHYVFRVQPMKGGAVAGDPSYTSLYYSSGNNGWNCSVSSYAGQSPLGNINEVTGQAAVRAAPTSTIALTWTAAKATHYVVTLKSKTSSYGSEFTTFNPQATLTFPEAARDQYRNPVRPSDVNLPYYSDYSLRIQPMNGTTPGDPVYKVVRYHFWNDGINDGGKN